MYSELSFSVYAFSYYHKHLFLRFSALLAPTLGMRNCYIIASVMIHFCVRKPVWFFLFNISPLKNSFLFFCIYHNTIVINDLIRRYKIRKESLFKSLVNYILRSNSRIFSARSICDYIKREHESCSINTIMKYIDHLQEAYIIESVKQYSTKTKRELSYYVKIYNADVAFNSIRCLHNRFDLTHNLENIVYNELVYMGYDIYVYNNAGKEIDFLAQKGNKKYYVQVAYSVAEEKAYNREFEAFKGIDNLSQKILITNDEIDY